MVLGAQTIMSPVAAAATEKAMASSPKESSDGGVFWIGQDGKVYVKGSQGTNSAGAADANTVSYWTSRGFSQIDDPNPPKRSGGDNDVIINGGGYSGQPKVLDTAQLRSLDALLDSLATMRDQGIEQARLRREEARNKKEEEFGREKGKYEGKKLSTLQDFGSTKTETDINTRNTLENLISSLSTMGLGGSRALTRQILAAANISNRKANATQAANTRDLDDAFNEYKGGYEADLTKIGDQYKHEVGEARRGYLQEKQNVLNKKADVYNAADLTADRERLMRQASGLNDDIANATFMNPKYDGKTRVMETPDLADYTQDIAQYDTTAIGANPADGLSPVGADGTTAPGNLAVRAIAVNDRDLGVKKKAENELGYGV